MVWVFEQVSRRGRLLVLGGLGSFLVQLPSPAKRIKVRVRDFIFIHVNDVYYLVYFKNM